METVIWQSYPQDEVIVLGIINTSNQTQINNYYIFGNYQNKDNHVMGRPPTKPKELRDGFYIEVRNKGTKTGIKLRRDTKSEMMQAVKEYEKIKDVTILGESKNCKWVDEKNTKKSKSKPKSKKS